MTIYSTINPQYGPKPIACQDYTSLAKQLMKTHGLKSALRICRENHWDGIIKILVKPVC